jgi:hypothetical protein
VGDGIPGNGSSPPPIDAGDSNPLELFEMLSGSTVPQSLPGLVRPVTRLPVVQFLPLLPRATLIRDDTIDLSHRRDVPARMVVLGEPLAELPGRQLRQVEMRLFVPQQGIVLRPRPDPRLARIEGRPDVEAKPGPVARPGRREPHPAVGIIPRPGRRLHGEILPAEFPLLAPLDGLRVRETLAREGTRALRRANQAQPQVKRQDNDAKSHTSTE